MHSSDWSSDVCSSHLPEVGQSLIEHRAILMSWKLGEPLSQNPSFGGWRLLRSVGQYFFSRSGPMAAATYEVGTWLKSRPDLARPDLQFLIDRKSTRLNSSH